MKPDRDLLYLLQDVEVDDSVGSDLVFGPWAALSPFRASEAFVVASCRYGRHGQRLLLEEVDEDAHGVVLADLPIEGGLAHALLGLPEPPARLRLRIRDDDFSWPRGRSGLRLTVALTGSCR